MASKKYIEARDNLVKAIDLANDVLLLAVVSGEKKDGSAQILSITDYYPFGMEMDGRMYVKLTADGGSKNNYFYENIESDALPLTTKLHDKGDQLFSYYTNSSDAPDNILAGSITKHSPDNGVPLPKNGYQGSLQIRNGNFYDVRYVESWEDDKTKPIYDSKANLNNGGIQHGLGLSMADRMSMEPTSYEKKKVVKKQHYKVKRADLMFHELCELFLRTDGGLYRGDDKSGAHHDSNQRAADAGFEPLNGNYSYGKKTK